MGFGVEKEAKGRGMGRQLGRNAKESSRFGEAFPADSDALLPEVKRVLSGQGQQAGTVSRARALSGRGIRGGAGGLKGGVGRGNPVLRKFRP